MARTKAGGDTGPLTPLARLAGTIGIVLGGIVIAAAFFAPGLALAGAMPAGATGAHPWIVDGGPEVANNMPWRIEIMVEYIALGLAALVVALRFGKALMVKLQDWYEGAPMVVAKPLAQTVPATVIPRPRAGKVAAEKQRELHAA